VWLNLYIGREIEQALALIQADKVGICPRFVVDLIESVSEPFGVAWSFEQRL
jgi:hypothetical protein